MVSVTTPPTPATAPSIIARRSAGALTVAARSSHSRPASTSAARRILRGPPSRAISSCPTKLSDRCSAFSTSDRTVLSGTTRASAGDGPADPAKRRHHQAGALGFPGGDLVGLPGLVFVERNHQDGTPSWRRARINQARGGDSSSIQVTLGGRRLEERRRDSGGHRSVQSPRDRVGLMRPGGQHQDRARGEDRGHAHGQGPGDDPLDAAEFAGRVGPSDGMEIDQARGQLRVPRPRTAR